MISNNHETPKAPKGYKQTEVGIIPEDWEVNNILDLGIIDSENLGASTPLEYKFNYISLEDVTMGILKSTKTYCFVNAPSRARRILRAKDILVSTVRPNLKSHYLIKDHVQDLICSTGFSVIRVNEKIAEPRYIYQHFFYNIINHQIDMLISGSNYPAISSKNVRELLIPIPPLKEQTAIANVLSDVDALIAELEKLIAKKEAIKTGAMQQLLTGRTRLPQFAKREDGTLKGYKDSELGKIPEDWEVISLFDLADNRKELFDDGDWIEAQYITDKGVRLIQTGNIGIGYFVEKNDKKYISEDSFSLLKCKKLKVRDILICRLAEPAGRACLFLGLSDENVITSVDVTIFRPLKNISREFYVQYFSTSEWFKSISEHVGGTTHKRISRGSLAKILVPLPKEEEQVAIAEILSDMDSEIEALEKRLEKTKALKQGMMQELLTGRTRLVS